MLDGSGGNGTVVRDAGTAPEGYAYVARRGIVAVGLAGATGFSDDDTHAMIDRIADAADACFKTRQGVAPGAARITLPVDAGGIAGAPDVVFSPPSSALAGMLCVLAPVRMSTFSPAAGDAGARSITIESAWNP